MSESDALLEIRDLNVSFLSETGYVPVVRNVSFSVAPRKIMAVVGESGSGKTVTMLSLLGLVDRRYTRVTGSVRFRGRELLELAPDDLRRLRGKDIAFISQDPMTALTPVYTIAWQIAEQVRAHEKISPALARRRAVDLLGEVGLPRPAETADRYPHELSGGMRQRAVIAMALSCSPAILIADEPTTALDVTVQAQVLRLLDRLRNSFGSSIILVTHSMGVVAEVADDVAVMYSGRVVEQADKASIFARPQHPYTWGLMASIPPLYGPRPERLASIPGQPPRAGDIRPGCGFASRCAYRMPICDTPPPRVQTAGSETLCHLSAEERDGPGPRARAHSNA